MDNPEFKEIIGQYNLDNFAQIRSEYHATNDAASHSPDLMIFQFIYYRLMDTVNLNPWLAAHEKVINARFFREIMNKKK